VKSAIVTVIALAALLFVIDGSEPNYDIEVREPGPAAVHRAEQAVAEDRAERRERKARVERRKVRAAERAQAEAVESATPVEEPDYTEPAPAVSGAPDVVMCESGGDYGINSGNGYYGGYQFDSQTWDAYGDPAYGEAHLAPPAVQDAAAAAVPYDAWPNC
jgi:hypothetical protein